MSALHLDQRSHPRGKYCALRILKFSLSIFNVSNSLATFFGHPSSRLLDVPSLDRRVHFPEHRWKSEAEQDIIDDEVSCFVTESSAGGEAAQPEHSEAEIAYCGGTEVATSTDYKTSSTVLSVDKDPKRENPFTQKEFLQAQKEKRLRGNRAVSVDDPVMFRLQPVGDTSPAIQVRWGPT